MPDTSACQNCYFFAVIKGRVHVGRCMFDAERQEVEGDVTIVTKQFVCQHYEPVGDTRKKNEAE